MDYYFEPSLRDIGVTSDTFSYKQTMSVNYKYAAYCQSIICINNHLRNTNEIFRSLFDEYRELNNKYIQENNESVRRIMSKEMTKMNGKMRKIKARHLFTYGVVKEVDRKKTTCPDCKCSIFWKRRAS